MTNKEFTDAYLTIMLEKEITKEKKEIAERIIADEDYFVALMEIITYLCANNMSMFAELAANIKMLIGIRDDMIRQKQLLQSGN